jgi:hypothetical protein
MRKPTLVKCLRELVKVRDTLRTEENPNYQELTASIKKANTMISELVNA